ncbi:MAG: hypothetical protein NTW49_09915 [Bacteroidia bacterium]|nr:hypothetical protein [Bacteroidia bacterium]
MPYRRLPNTDSARLKALRTALKKGMELSPVDMAITSATYQKLKSFLPCFEQEMIQLKAAYSTQVEKNKDYLDLQKKARLYISHFLQVLNFSIARGELPPAALTFYGLGENNHKIPLLNSDPEIIKWGSLVVKGETERVGKGGNIITNPTSALVNVWYEKFCDAYHYQKNLQKNTSRALSRVSGLRSEADSIIVKVWNEVEDKFRLLPDEERRQKAGEYGIIYVFRKSELEPPVNNYMAEDRASRLIEMINQEENSNEEEMLQYSFLFPENQENY